MEYGCHKIQGTWGHQRIYEWLGRPQQITQSAEGPYTEARAQEGQVNGCKEAPVE